MEEQQTSLCGNTERILWQGTYHDAVYQREAAVYMIGDDVGVRWGIGGRWENVALNSSIGGAILARALAAVQVTLDVERGYSYHEGQDPDGINALRRRVMAAAKNLHHWKEQLARVQREATRKSAERFDEVLKGILAGVPPPEPCEG